MKKSRIKSDALVGSSETCLEPSRTYKVELFAKI